MGFLCECVLILNVFYQGSFKEIYDEFYLIDWDFMYISLGLQPWAFTLYTMMP